MPRPSVVGDVMTTDVLALRPGDAIQDAMQALVARDVDGAPVVDDRGRVVGVLTTDDLLVQESRLHYPTVVSLFGAYLELPSSHRHFEEDLRKAVGATVADVMSDEPVTCAETDTLEQVATTMHERHIDRLPVVRDGALVGIVARGDILRALVAPGD